LGSFIFPLRKNDTTEECFDEDDDDFDEEYYEDSYDFEDENF
jgi:hypothetical protein